MNTKEWVKKVIVLISVLIALSVILCLFLCPKESSHGAQFVYDADTFRQGDLIVRRGNGAESHFVTTVSHADYSHVGILCCCDSGYWYVIHAVPDEAPDGGTDYVKCEPIDSFLRADRAEYAAVVELDCSDSVRAAAVEYAMSKYRARIEFDHDYLLSDTTRMYCTELIWRSYLSQNVDLADARRHSLYLFREETDFIFPIDVLDSPYVKNMSRLKKR